MSFPSTPVESRYLYKRGKANITHRGRSLATVQGVDRDAAVLNSGRSVWARQTARIKSDLSLRRIGHSVLVACGFAGKCCIQAINYSMLSSRSGRVLLPCLLSPTLLFPMLSGITTPTLDSTAATTAIPASSRLVGRDGCAHSSPSADFRYLYRLPPTQCMANSLVSEIMEITASLSPHPASLLRKA